MKLKVSILCLLMAASVLGQGTRQRVPVTTTDFTRSWLTNETAYDLRTALGVTSGGGTNESTPLLSSPTIAVTLISLASNRLDVVGTLTNNTTGTAEKANRVAAGVTNDWRAYALALGVLYTNAMTANSNLQYLLTVAATNDLPYLAGGTNASIRQVSGAGGLTNFLDTVPASSPVKVISPTRPANGDTNWYGPWTAGTFTAGIQEAINSLPIAATTNGSGGGTLHFMPGRYFTATNITFPAATKGRPYSLVLWGSGMTASGIVYTNSTPQNVLTIGHDESNAPYIFDMRDMFVASNTNACTNIILISGAGDANRGGVARGSIKNCYIGFWNSMISNNCGTGPVFSPSSCNDGIKHNLVGINVNLNYSDPFIIAENSINYVGCAISWATDHGAIVNNMIEHCGNENGLSDWPVTSIYYPGASIVLKESTLLNNANKSWEIADNTFVACKLHYLANLFNGTSTNMYYRSANNILIANDGDESGVALAATTGSPITFLNPKFTAYELYPLVSYHITNTTDYSTWNTHIARANEANGSNVVAIIDHRRGQSTVGHQYGNTVSAPQIGVGTNAPTFAMDIRRTNYTQIRAVSVGDDSLVTLGSTITGTSNWTFGATSSTSGSGSNKFVFGTSQQDGFLLIPKFTLDANNGQASVIGFWKSPTNTPVDGYVQTATGTAGDTAWAAAAGSGASYSDLTDGTNAVKAFTQAAVASVWTNGTPGNGAGLTNVYGPTVNYVVTNLALDEQTIYLSGAGTAAVNGRYVLQTPTNVYLTYYSAEWTNSAGTGWTLAWNSIYSGKYTVTNASDLGDVAYEADTINQWAEDLSGAFPPPSGGFSNVYSYVTNTVILTTNKQFYSAPNNKTFLVDGYSGLDSNPWPAPRRTLTAAFSNVITADSTILIGMGTVSNFLLTPSPNNSHIIGMGKDVSTIHGGVWVGTNTTLQDFSTSGDGQIFNYQLQSGEINTNLGGLKMRNLSVNGAVDGLFIRNFWLTILAENCDFTSGYDAVNYPNTTNNGNIGNATLINCTFNVLGSSTFNRGYSVYTTNTVHRFYGGQFNVSNTFNANPAYGLWLANGARAEVYGAVFWVTNTFAGGVSSAIFTTNGSTVSGYWWENGTFKVAGAFSPSTFKTTNSPANGNALRYTNGNFYWAP